MAWVASDIEGTLTTGTMWRAVLEYLETEKHLSVRRAFLARKMPGIVLVRLGLMDGDKFRDRWIEDLAAFFTGWTESDLNTMAEWVVAQEWWPKRRNKVVAELERHVAQGHQVFLVSGGFAPVIAAFGRHLGAAQTTGTELAFVNGKCTGHCKGVVCTGDEKNRRVRAILSGLDERLAAAYGDTGPDIPMLSLSRDPVAVAPDKNLRQHAVAQGWRILEA
jgi:phosphoserine phosphatase